MKLLGALLEPGLRRLPCCSGRTGGERCRHASPAVLERAERAGTATRLELGALTRDEADDSGSATGRSHGNNLYEDSGGNPFYLERLHPRMLDRARPAPGPQGGRPPFGGAHVPPVVAAAIAEELGLLSVEARLVLEGAAVAGDPFDPGGAQGSAVRRRSRRSTNCSSSISCVGGERAAPLPVWPSSRPPIRLRGEPGRLAARGARERSAAGPAGTRSPGIGARPPRGALGAPRDAPAIATLREAGDAAVQRAPASAARWFGAALRLTSAATPRPASGSICCCRTPRRSPAAAASRRVAPP